MKLSILTINYNSNAFGLRKTILFYLKKTYVV